MCWENGSLLKQIWPRISKHIIFCGKTFLVNHKPIRTQLFFKTVVQKLDRSFFRNIFPHSFHTVYFCSVLKCLFMKKVVYLLTALSLIVTFLFAQNPDYIKNPSLSFYFVLDDFNAANYIRANSLHDAISNHKITNFSGMDPGIAIGYQQGISKHFDFGITLAATTTDYPTRANDGTTLGSNSLLLEAEASLIGKMLSDKHIISPFWRA